MIPKGEKCGSKQGIFSRKKKFIPKGEKYISESSHKGEVARSGEDQRWEIMVSGGGQVIIGWW